MGKILWTNHHALPQPPRFYKLQVLDIHDYFLVPNWLRWRYALLPQPLRWTSVQAKRGMRDTVTVGSIAKEGEKGLGDASCSWPTNSEGIGPSFCSCVISRKLWFVFFLLARSRDPGKMDEKGRCRYIQRRVAFGRYMQFSALAEGW